MGFTYEGVALSNFQHCDSICGCGGILPCRIDGDLPHSVHSVHSASMACAHLLRTFPLRSASKYCQAAHDSHAGVLPYKEESDLLSERCEMDHSMMTDATISAL